jgi:hypothetical protein
METEYDRNKGPIDPSFSLWTVFNAMRFGGGSENTPVSIKFKIKGLEVLL